MCTGSSARIRQRGCHFVRIIAKGDLSAVVRHVGAIQLPINRDVLRVDLQREFRVGEGIGERMITCRRCCNLIGADIC